MTLTALLHAQVVIVGVLGRAQGIRFVHVTHFCDLFILVKRRRHLEGGGRVRVLTVTQIERVLSEALPIVKLSCGWLHHDSVVCMTIESTTMSP